MSPAFVEPRHVGAPNIVDREGFLRRVEGMLDSGRLTNHGPLVSDFERRIADLAGVGHCIAVCNGTIGLEIAIRALGLTGEVIVPSWTFVATAHALQWQEITPVFADVSPLTHTLDPRSVESMITPRTTGIVGVHLFARACDHDALADIAERHGLELMYDAAHALGVTHRGRPVGGLGRAEVVSFHATKFINTLEGGAILTDDAELAERIRLMTNFGFAGRDRVVHLGTNGKLNEVCAAMGLAQLDSLGRILAANEARYQAYAAGLHSIPGVALRHYDPAERTNWQYIVVEVDAEAAGLTRDELLAELEADNVLARRYFHPGAHRMEPYRSLQPHAGLLLPETERLADSTLVLPTGTAMSIADVETVCGLVAAAVERAGSRGARNRAPLVGTRP
jgi:dTDP-4-amino-4,6-dideoxygalactose transaminase